MSRKLSLGLLLGTIALWAQPATEARFTSVLDNPQAAVYSLDMPPRSRAVVFQGTHDVIWLALNDAAVTFSGHDRSTTAELKSGDVRFFSAFQLASVSNGGAAAAKGVLVELKARGDMPACGCGSAIERSVCGCSGGAHLPALWAFGFGKITLGGTTLNGRESFLGSSYRDDMLLLAVTDVDLKDDASAQPAEIRLAPGEARWVPAGSHQFRNLTSDGARFVTVEF